MIDEFDELYGYIPVEFKSTDEANYINFLFETVKVNFENNKYQFSFLALNMIYMYFIYLVVIKIKENMQQDFEKALIPFDNDKEKKILNILDPSSFQSTGEKEAIRFLKLIGADNKKIGDWTRIIKDRDEVAHSNVIKNTQMRILLIGHS